MPLQQPFTLWLLAGNASLGRLDEVDEINDFRYMIHFRQGSFDGFIEGDSNPEKNPVNLF
jgi:hypothetical protein